MTNQSFMRSVLSISISESAKKKLLKRAKMAGKSVSSYVLDAISLKENVISEDELVKMAKKTEEEYEKGETKELKSLADLMS